MRKILITISLAVVAFLAGCSSGTDPDKNTFYAKDYFTLEEGMKKYYGEYIYVDGAPDDFEHGWYDSLGESFTRSGVTAFEFSAITTAIIRGIS